MEFFRYNINLNGEMKSSVLISIIMSGEQKLAVSTLQGIEALDFKALNLAS